MGAGSAGCESSLYAGGECRVISDHLIWRSQAAAPPDKGARFQLVNLHLQPTVLDEEKRLDGVVSTVPLAGKNTAQPAACAFHLKVLANTASKATAVCWVRYGLLRIASEMPAVLS